MIRDSLAELEHMETEVPLWTGCADIDVRCAALGQLLLRGRQAQAGDGRGRADHPVGLGGVSRR